MAGASSARLPGHTVYISTDNIYIKFILQYFNPIVSLSLQQLKLNNVGQCQLSDTASSAPIVKQDSWYWKKTGSFQTYCNGEKVMALKPGIYWRQSWIEHCRLFESAWTKSTVSLWPCTHWRQSRKDVSSSLCAGTGPEVVLWRHPMTS